MEKLFLLTAENIDGASELIREFMQSQKAGRQDIIRTRLSVESILLEWQEMMPEGTEFMLNCYTKFLRPMVRIVMAGKCCDPSSFKNAEEDYFAQLQGNLGLSTSFKYVNGLNIFDIKMPLRSLNSTGKIALSIVAAVLTYQLSGFLPPDVVAAINGNLIMPSLDMILGLIKAVASLLIFFNVLSAISNMGDFTTLSRLGRGLMRKSQIVNLFALAVGTVLAAVIFPVLDFSGGLSFASVGEIYKMVLAVVPVSIVDPFVNGNTLQILFLAVCGGALLLVLDRQVGDLVHVVNQCNLFFMTSISYFCSIVPVIIYLSFTGILLSGGLMKILNMWKVMAAIYAEDIFFILSVTAWTAWRSGFNLRQHFARVMPITVMAFSTASSAACIPLMNKTLNEHGVDTHYREFALPFSQIIGVGGTLISWPSMIFGLLALYGGTMSVPALLMNLFSYWLLAHTMPPVPGGGVSVMTLLILQAGLSKEYVALYLAVDLVCDMIQTCGCNTHVINNVFACAAEEGKIKRD